MKAKLAARSLRIFSDRTHNSKKEKRRLNSIVVLKDLALSRSHNDTPETMIFEKTSGITSWSQPDSNPLRKSCEISLATRMEYDRTDLYI